MLQPRFLGMGCRALALVGLAATLSVSAAMAASPFDGLGGFGGLGNQGGNQGGHQGNQGGKKKDKDPLTMVMPSQSLPATQQLNRAMNFNRLGLSQTAVGSNILQTAIVSVSQMGGGSPKTLFLPASQLGAMKTLNLDLNFNVMAVTQLAVGSNIQQVAIVNVEQKNQGGGGGGYEDPFGGGGQQGGGSQGGGQQGGGQQGGGQQGGGQQGGGTTLVAPWDDMPTLKAANHALNYNVMRVSQTAVGDNIGQTAILNVGQSNSSSAGTPMFIPAHQVGLYKALNLHLNINVITITQVAIGDNIQQLALVSVGQGN